MKKSKQFTVYSLQKMHRVLFPSVNRQLSTVNSQRGFTLLLAALVSSIVLAVGAAIFGIAQKQVLLSSIGRDSQFAFYAADTAAECALYWDFRFSYFATTTPASVSDPSCDGETLTPFDVLPQQGQPFEYPYTMTSQRVNLFSDVTLSGSGNLCAEVSVTKSLDSLGAVRTVIHANGYSTRCASILTSSRALQRSVELRY